VGPYLDRRQIPSYLDGLLIPKIDSLVMISRNPGYLRSSGLKASKDTGEALKGWSNHTARLIQPLKNIADKIKRSGS
jgi:hypothetical protein